jgi:hypothetical protein
MVTDGEVVSAGVVGVEPPSVAAVLVSVLLSAPPPQAERRDVIMAMNAKSDRIEVMPVRVVSFELVLSMLNIPDFIFEVKFQNRSVCRVSRHKLLIQAQSRREMICRAHEALSIMSLWAHAEVHQRENIFTAPGKQLPDKVFPGIPRHMKSGRWGHRKGRCHPQ